MNKNNCSLVITTINKANKNINKCSFFSKRKKWNFFVVGDKKTPKNFKLQYGNYLNLEDQKKLNFKFSKFVQLILILERILVTFVQLNINQI